MTRWSGVANYMSRSVNTSPSSCYEIDLFPLADQTKYRLRVKYTYLYSTNTYEMLLTIDIPMRSLACCLCCLSPLRIYTSPFLRISFAPVLVLMFRRLSPPLPITKPLYPSGISTISSGGGVVVLRLCASCCRGEKTRTFKTTALWCCLAMLFTPSLRSKQAG